MRFRQFNIILTGFFLASVVLFSCATDSNSKKVLFPEDHAEKLEWWKDQRFGMFITWGPIALEGLEIGWSRGREISIEEYDKLYKRFNPVNFDAEEWVKIGKDAGMKYLVFVARHHCGFIMWDSEHNDYNIMNSPFGRDIVQELADACKKYDMPLVIYNSTCDWLHPDFPLTSPAGRVEREVHNLDRYTDYLKDLSVELIEKYGPLVAMWYDVPQVFDSIRGQGVIDHIREVQPGILVNNRTGAPGDFDTPEQQVGGFRINRPWETCMTIARQWAWRPNDVVKTLEQCMHSLIRAAGGDGNLVLSVGPTADGRIEPEQVERLKEMGDWLKEYGHTIYGTRGGPYKPTDWGVSTRKDNMIYLHVLSWFEDSPRLVLPDFGMDIIDARLSNGHEVKLSKQAGNIIIEFPAEQLLEINTIVELELLGNVMGLEPMEVPAHTVSYGKETVASSVSHARWHNPSSITNGDWVSYYWVPTEEDPKPWIEIDLGKPEIISRAILFEAGFSGFLLPVRPQPITEDDSVDETEQPIEAYELQYLSGDEWITFHEGGRIGTKKELSFPKIETEKVRLVIKEYSKAPGIYEFVLLH